MRRRVEGSPSTCAAVPRAPLDQSRPIRGQRIRLDPDPICSEPQDLDPMALLARYRFGLVYLLKSPCALLDSTRITSTFKSICSSAQNLSRTPLTFLKIEPAVLAGQFYVLDPRSNY